MNANQQLRQIIGNFITINCCQWKTYSMVIFPNMSMRTRKKNTCTVQAILRRSMCYDGQHTWRKYWVEVFATVALQMTGTAPSKQHPFVFLPYRGCQLHPFTSTAHNSGFAVNTNRIYSRPRSQITALISRLWDAREIIPLCLCRMTNTSATIVDNSLVLHWQQRNWSITNLSKTLNLSSYKKTHSTRWCIQNSFPCSINNKNFRPDRESIWFARASEFVGWVCEIPNWRCALCRKEIEFYKMAWIIWVHREVVFIFMEWTEQHHNSQVGFRLKNPSQLEKFYCRQKNRLQDFIHQSESIIQIPYDWRHLFLLLQSSISTLGMKLFSLKHNVWCIEDVDVWSEMKDTG